MKILTYPELRQTYEYDCGANALQSILTYYGVEMREEIILKTAKTDKKIGTTVKGAISVLAKYELHYESKTMTVDDLKEYIDRGIPSMLLIQAWNGCKKHDYTRDYHDGHWVVAIGYDSSRIVFEDPYAFERVFLSHDELVIRWHAKENGEKIKNHGIAVYGKKPKYDPKKIIHMG